MSFIYKLTSNKAKIIKAFKDPLYGLGLFLNQIAPLIKNDRIFLTWKYYTVFHKKLNLDNPLTYNEKLQWLKLHNRKPEYTKMVDKAEAKKYAANIIGKEYIIPTLGVFNSFDEINFNQLPDQFVIKCTHDSGGVVVCKDKSKLDIRKAREKIEYGLGKTNYWGTREWPYKNVEPRIIIEQYLEDESGYELKDYKVHCFNGEPKFILVASGRHQNDIRFNFYDLNWNLMPFEKSHKRIDSNITIAKPDNLDEMLNLAKSLSTNIPHLRVDFYIVRNKIYFGELTFFPASGLGKFNPEEWDKKIGQLLHLELSEA